MSTNNNCSKCKRFFVVYEKREVVNGVVCHTICPSSTKSIKNFSTKANNEILCHRLKIARRQTLSHFTDKTNISVSVNEPAASRQTCIEKEDKNCQYATQAADLTADLMVNKISTCPFISPSRSVQKYSDSRCPFSHGTVYAGPYPGYVHGRNPAIDSSGCIPSLDPYPHETIEAALLREAFEYQLLYHKENSSPPCAAEARFREIESSIRSTGTYDLTLEELQYGARVAWRNAPKCSNRSKWNELHVLDKRTVRTNQEAFDSVLDLLDKSLTSMATKTYMTVFRQRLPGEAQGPRIWNSMLLRFAGYYKNVRSEATGGILGDPVDADFTKMLIERFGWVPPSPRTAFDPLPLLLQMSEHEAPEIFSFPSSYIPFVHIRHHDYPQLDVLGLKWFPVPVVSSMEFHVGGLFFTAAPFVGWFADHEVVRNLVDKGRYNILPAVAKALELDSSPANECWKEEASLVLNKAVVSSYRNAGVSMVSHHSMLSEFIKWYEMEKKTRGYCPGNWKWIIPPIGASLCDAYLKLNKMTEFTLKPAIMPPRPAGWKRFTAPDSIYSLSADSESTPCAANQTPSLTRTEAANRLAAFWKRTVNRQIRPTIFLIYASVTGVAAEGANRLAALCKDKFRVHLVNLADWNPAKHFKHLTTATVFVCLTSTYGSGNIPHHANSFLAWIGAQKETRLLNGVYYSVLGFGSSAYPRFCEAAVTFDRSLNDVGCVRVAPLGKVDALKGSDLTFVTWTLSVFSGLNGFMEQEAHSSRDERFATKRDEPKIKNKIRNALNHFVLQLKPDLVRTTYSHSIFYLTTDSICTIASKWPSTRTGIVSSTRILYNKSIKNDGIPERVVTCVSVDVQKVPGGTFYSPGDNVAIFPRQSEAAVLRAAQAFGIESKLDTIFGFERPGSKSGYDNVVPFPTPTNVRTALTTFLGIESRPSAESIRRLLGYAKGSDSTKLYDILGNSASGGVDEWLVSNCITWVTCFEHFPSLRVDFGGVPLSVLLNIIPPQHPRYYSIASSLDVTPGEFTLVVGHHAFTVGRNNIGAVDIRHGTCSSYIRDLLVGDEVEFHIIPVRSFRLPISNAAPVVCISTGTGFAPIYGFVQQRLQRMRESKSKLPADEFILIHGARDESELPFAKELKLAVATKAITAIHYALSRSAFTPKQYVQDLIRSPVLAAQLYKLLTTNEKSSVYVCGDANMANSVRAALSNILSPQILQTMVDRGTYREEIFGLFNFEKK
mmetsp:Transcript_15657/g.21485  ORF Transcript_15657/g.21485 Transcript_15657/m.21485 type:complete len:1231 (-) Transcript_15657:403-4095(-)